MCGCRDLARKHGVGIHSHVGESKVQALMGIRRYGKALVQHMDDLDLIGPDFTAAHTIWLDDNDLKIMRDKGGSLAHNPDSNMPPGNCMFRFRETRDMGANGVIGTDGAHCSDNQNMYEAMRHASTPSKTQTPNPRRWARLEEV
ncbi:MAG: amidohydrolase family protein [Roseomonas sp.]|nr:amidohydrolase family protein [Roseomonas sp.]